MRIREYTPADFEALRRLHAAQGFGYPLPDLESPLFVSNLVLEASREVAAEGREEANAGSPLAANADPLTGSAPGEPSVTMAILLRLTAEAYLLHDPSAGTPRRRWQNFLALHEAARHRESFLVRQPGSVPKNRPVPFAAQLDPAPGGTERPLPFHRESQQFQPAAA
jgi:hypothetical protein